MLNKKYRLKRQRDFLRLYKRGRSVAYPAFVLYCRERDSRTKHEFVPRVGFSVSKKVGNAVTRNRIKRRFRHAVREEMAHFIAGQDYVFIVRNAALRHNYASLRSQMHRALTEIMSRPKQKNGSQRN